MFYNRYIYTTIRDSTLKKYIINDLLRVHLKFKLKTSNYKIYEELNQYSLLS